MKLIVRGLRFHASYSVMTPCEGRWAKPSADIRIETPRRHSGSGGGPVRPGSNPCQLGQGPWHRAQGFGDDEVNSLGHDEMRMHGLSE